MGPSRQPEFAMILPLPHLRQRYLVQNLVGAAFKIEQGPLDRAQVRLVQDQPTRPPSCKMPPLDRGKRIMVQIAAIKGAKLYQRIIIVKHHTSALKGDHPRLAQFA
jgi:hypothetical protein